MNHGGVYKITNAKDGNVLDVSNGKFEENTSVLSFPWHGGDNQIWKADKEAVGFRLVPAKGKVFASGMIALDESAQTSSAILYRFHGGKNQQWTAVPVANWHKMYYIKNAATGRVLTNAKGGAKIQTAAPKGDSSQYWTFTSV